MPDQVRQDDSRTFYETVNFDKAVKRLMLSYLQPVTQFHRYFLTNFYDIVPGTKSFPISILVDECGLSPNRLCPQENREPLHNSLSDQTKTDTDFILQCQGDVRLRAN